MESIADQERGLRGRRERGIELFETGAFEKTGSGWIVENPANGHVSEVDLGRGTCSCADFEHHGRLVGFRCKHLVGVDLYVRWLKESAQVIAPVFGEVA